MRDRGTDQKRSEGAKATRPPRQVMKRTPLNKPCGDFSNEIGLGWLPYGRAA